MLYRRSFDVQIERGYSASAETESCIVKLYFHCAFRFNTLRLAYMLDSLVRVSRRVGQVDDLYTSDHEGRRSALIISVLMAVARTTVTQQAGNRRSSTYNKLTTASHYSCQCNSTKMQRFCRTNSPQQSYDLPKVHAQLKRLNQVEHLASLSVSF